MKNCYLIFNCHSSNRQRGDDGMTAMNKFGNMAAAFNSEEIYRVYINSSGKTVVEI